MLPTLWLSGFVLGVSLFTPMSSFMLGIDYYEEAFPGAQVAVKVTVCYEAAFVALQLLCHLGDAKLPLSRAARIEARHMIGVVIMAFVILWDRVIVGPGAAPAYALNILLAVVTLNGALDGVCVGAVFGEMAILGPSSAHALVAGTAGVMPFLAVLRIIFKAALPATREGMRLSLVLYFAAAAVVLLAGLAVYCLVVLPAISAAQHDGQIHGTFIAAGTEDELGVMPLIPTLMRGGAKSHAAAAEGSRQLQMTLSLPTSMRGTSLLVRRVHTGLAPSHLRCGSFAGAVHAMEASGTLQGPSQVGFLPNVGSGRRHELPKTASGKGMGRQLSNQLSGCQDVQQEMEGGMLAPAATSTIVEADEDAASNSSSSATAQRSNMAAARQKPDAQQQQQQRQHQHTCKEADSSAAVTQQQAHSDVISYGDSKQHQQQATSKQEAHKQLLSPFAHLPSSWAAPKAAVHAAGGLQQQQACSVNQSITYGQLKSAAATGEVASLLDSLVQQELSSKPAAPQYFAPGQSVWRSNWLLLKGNVWYVAATVLTYVCNYTVFPGFITYVVPSAALGSWYSLLLVATYGIGDVTGKLLPLWRPARPQATVMALAVARLLLFLALFSVALLLQAGPYVFFPAVFVMALSAWYEAMIFSLACDGQHADDAYQVESMLAIQLDVGIALGSTLSLAWSAGPWAVIRGPA